MPPAESLQPNPLTNEGSNRLHATITGRPYLGDLSTRTITIKAMDRIVSRILLVICLALDPASDAVGQLVDLDTVKAGRYDNGKMWTFDYPPVEHFKEAYGFEPEPEWFEKARLGALRLPNCTASFVSPHGLVMTNHHCARDAVEQVSGPNETLSENGFFSRSLDEERRVPGLYVDQLIALEDVTEEVYEALEGEETDAEKAAARQEAIETIINRVSERAGGADAGIVVEVIDLYHGGRYSAYTFRRYADVRLVMSPELELGFFGGDTDNFTYPRFALDVSFLRVFEDGEPYRPEHYFAWSEEGADEGDVVFVVGNPGSTLRLNTPAQLEWRRDVEDKYTLALFESRIEELVAHYEEDPSPALLNEIFSLRNSEKLYTGRLEGLHDPVIMAKRADTERQFLNNLQELHDSLGAAEIPPRYLTIGDELARIQEEKREFAAEFGAFLGMNPGAILASATMGRGFLALVYLVRQANGASEATLDLVAEDITSITQDPGIDRRYLKARLSDFVTYFGEDAPGVLDLLDGRTIDEVVDEVFASSVLTSPEKAAEAIDTGTLTPDDPAVELLLPFLRRYQDYQSAFAGLSAQEEELNALHGRARFEIYGTSQPPDATFSLRIADGVVSSYDYNGTRAPAFTTYYGLYNRHYSHALDADPTGEWELPDRWLNPPEAFELSTPLNLVSTNDTVGGNSGSPLLNKDLEIVGLIFDSNIDGLPGAYIYETEQARAIAVDARGIREALDDMYDMDRIVHELMEGELVESEEEADLGR